MDITSEEYAEETLKIIKNFQEKIHLQEFDVRRIELSRAIDFADGDTDELMQELLDIKYYSDSRLSKIIPMEDGEMVDDEDGEREDNIRIFNEMSNTERFNFYNYAYSKYQSSINYGIGIMLRDFISELSTWESIEGTRFISSIHYTGEDSILSIQFNAPNLLQKDFTESNYVELKEHLQSTFAMNIEVRVWGGSLHGEEFSYLNS